MNNVFAFMAVGPFFSFCIFVLYRLLSLGHGYGGDLVESDFKTAALLGAVPTVCGVVGLFLTN